MDGVLDEMDIINNFQVLCIKQLFSIHVERKLVEYTLLGNLYLWELHSWSPFYFVLYLSYTFYIVIISKFIFRFKFYKSNS